jgi:hypothetical protein
LAYLEARTVSREKKSVKERSHAYMRTGSDGPQESLSYGFNKCVELAKDNPANALINPDNYRLFAEMSMSPATVWTAAKP